MKQLQVRKLTNEEIKNAYYGSLIYDFPRGEQKPLALIHALLEENQYHCYGLFLGQRIKGYAFFCSASNPRVLLLDYFCILQNERSSGYGSKFLKLLSTTITEVDGLILEVEDDEYPIDDEDLLIRQRRFAFYFANGVKMTNVRSSVKKVKYKVMFFPLNHRWEDSEVACALGDVYNILYGGELHDQIVDYIKCVG